MAALGIAAAGRHAARHRAHRRHGARSSRRCIEKGHAYRTDDGSVFFRIASWPAYGRLARLDPDAAAAGRARRGRRVRQGRRPRLRALEGGQARRAELVDLARGRSPGLAHRVLGDEHALPRAELRHPHRRHRPRLPAPRGRDRAVRGRDRRSPSCAPGCTARTCSMGGQKMAKRTGNFARPADVYAAGVSARGRCATRSWPPTTARRSSSATRRWPHAAAAVERLGHGGRGAGRLRRGASRRPRAAGRSWRRRARPSRPRSRTTSTSRPRWRRSSSSSASSTAASPARTLSSADAATRGGRPPRARRGARRPGRGRARSCRDGLAALLEARAAARAARDWARSDELRDAARCGRRRRRGHARRPALAQGQEADG